MARNIKNICEKCHKYKNCTEICKKVEKNLPSVTAGADYSKEVSVDPKRVERYGKNIKMQGLDPDKRTEKWLSGNDNV